MSGSVEVVLQYMQLLILYIVLLIIDAEVTNQGFVQYLILAINLRAICGQKEVKNQN
jgi:hypothetical protein